MQLSLMPHFSGRTYSAPRDHARLTGQNQRVFDAMRGGEWFTLREISALASAPEASVSARMRDLRKERFGAHTVNSRSREGKGTWEYQLIVRGKS